MSDSYDGVEKFCFEPEDFDDVNILNLPAEWLAELREEYDYYTKTPVDVRIHTLLEHLQMMADSKAIWYVNITKSKTPSEDKEDGMVGC